MDKFNVAVISTNNFNESGDNMTKTEITENIPPFIEFQSTTGDTMMEKIINITNMTPTLMGDTSLCFEDSKYVIQLCHVSPEDNMEVDIKLDINGIGSYLVADNRKVYGAIVVMKFEIMEDNTCKNISIELNDIIDIVFRKFNHVGVAIDANGNKKTISFNTTPLETIETNLHSTYKSIEVNLFGNVFLMFIEIYPHQNKVNKIATRLAGNCIVHGNAIFAAKGSDLLFTDLTMEYFDKIERLCWGKFKNRCLKGIELQNREKINNLPIVMNAYRIVDNRLKECKKVCSGCDAELTDKTMVCTGCYRSVYDSIECQKNHWVTHKSECLLNKKPINEALQSDEGII